jgi:hypothetical protein
MSLPLRRSFPLKVAGIIGLIGLIVFIISLPAKSYGFGADTNPTVEGFNGFSGIETYSTGERFNWSLSTSTQLFPNVPRYAPLELRLKVNLARPEGAPPARIEIFEGTARPDTDFNPVGVITFDPNNPATRDYYFTVPARNSGEGLLLQFKTNAFQVKNDARQLGFIFYNSEISLPQKHLLSLAWPAPFMPASIILLVVLTTWTLRAGLSWLETLLFSGLTAFVLLTIAPATFHHGWWLLLIALGIGAVYWWEGWNIRANGRWGVLPIMVAAGLLLTFFLFSGLSYEGDTLYYTRWSAAIHEKGLWNYDPKFNYLPMLSYIIWVYNLAAYPFDFHDSYLAWRIFASLAFLAVIFVIHQLLKLYGKENQNQAVEAGKENAGYSRQWLILLAFNVAFFYNAVIWGQSDIFPVLALVITLFFIFRRQSLAGGLMMGVLIISKPQAWFLLPILALLLLQRCGWKRTLAGLSLGGAVAVVLSAAPFGLDLNQVVRYFNQPEFTGTYTNSNPNATNFNYLIITNQRVELPVWMSLVGALVVATTLGLIVYFSRGISKTLKQAGLEAGLFAFTCFTWLIKMKERYVIYGIPFLGIAAILDRRLFKPFLVLSWLQLLQLTIAMFQEDRSRTKTLADNFYLWSVTLNRVETQWLMSVVTIGLWGYLLFFYIRKVALNRETTRPEAEVNSKELVSPTQ